MIFWLIMAALVGALFLLGHPILAAGAAALVIFARLRH